MVNLTKAKLSNNEQDRKLIDLVSKFGGVLCGVYALVTLPIHNYQYTIISAVTSIICWMVFWLNRKNFYTLALLLFFIGLSIMMVVYTYFFGNINAEIYLISGGVFSSFLVKRAKLRNEIVWVFITLMFLLSTYILFNSGRFNEATALEKLLYIPNTLAGIGLIYLVTRFFRNSEEQQRNELNHSNKLKERLIFILSHDLKTPINSINSLLSLYKRGHISANDLDEYLIKTQAQVASTSILLDSMLMWVNTQIDYFTPAIKTYNLADEIKSDIQSFTSSGLPIKLKIKEHSVISTDITIHSLVVKNIIETFLRWAYQNDISLEITVYKNHISFFCNSKQIPKINTEAIHSEIESYPGTITAKNRNIGLKICTQLCASINHNLKIQQDELNQGTKISIHYN
ncbi:MAG: hypothetical protein ACPGLV_00315 [Bacteroidia bacterium]